MIPYNQLSLADIFSDCQKIYESEKPSGIRIIHEKLRGEGFFERICAPHCSQKAITINLTFC